MTEEPCPIVYLSEEDFKRLLAAIEAPPAPNPRLVELMRDKKDPPV